MLPDRVSNPGPLTYESGALPIALRGPATTSTYQCFGIMIREGDKFTGEVFEGWKWVGVTNICFSLKIISISSYYFCIYICFYAC